MKWPDFSQSHLGKGVLALLLFSAGYYFPLFRPAGTPAPAATAASAAASATSAPAH